MRRQIGKRAQKAGEHKDKFLSVSYVKENTQNNLALRRDHLYLEDVKNAININALEQRILLRKDLLRMLESDMPLSVIKQRIFKDLETDRHTLMKRYHLKVP
ncbi:MAG: hypothetical protein K9I68_08910 [Bacteroidales bacterium]|nr:hypothetical protein [Bacteroidales bacterium]MCF8338323.1 hypothetical protein [Bacteroidales bacterium]